MKKIILSVVLVLLIGSTSILSASYTFTSSEQKTVDAISDKLEEILPTKSDWDVNIFLKIIISLQKKLDINSDVYEKKLCNL